MTTRQLLACFDGDAPPLEAFVDALGRCALTAFRYATASDTPPPLEFRDAFSTDAKQMWVDSLLSTEAQLLREGASADAFRSPGCTTPAGVLRQFGTGAFATPLIAGGELSTRSSGDSGGNLELVSGTVCAKNEVRA